MRLDRSDALCAGLLCVAGAALCMQAFASGPWGARPSTEDELAYLFQARALAGGHLTYPSPPHPEFFEAAHILVMPRFAAKYLPGHAAVLAPFLAAGAPWLAPCLLLGITAALLFVAARAAGLSRPASLGSAILLLGAADVFPYFASYLSQTTSVTLSAAAIVALLAVRSRPSRARIGLLSAAVVAAALVRPFTGLALAFAAVALLSFCRLPVRTLWPAAAPIAAGILVLALVCHATTGSWTTTPWALYARQYMPFDGPGIGAVQEHPPERGFPPHLKNLYAGFLESRKQYTFARLPENTAQRLVTVARFLPAWLLLPFALAGLAWAPLWPAAIFALAYFLLQLTFHVGGAVYHLEIFPWLALSTAAGAQLAFDRANRLRRPLRAVALCALALALGWPLVRMAREVREIWVHAPERPWPYARWEPAFQLLREQHALVFVRYSRNWDGNLDLTYNEPDLNKAEVVRAIDRGEANDELIKAFPGRPVFRFDPLTLRLSRLQ